eukprot:g4255.t1
MSCCGGKCPSPSNSSRYPTPVDPLKCGDGKKWKNLPGQRQNFSSKRNGDVYDPYVYVGNKLVAVDFPIGGIGAGNIFLQGDGTIGQFTIVNQCREETEMVACMPSCFFGMSTSAGQNFLLSAPTTYEIRSYRKQSSNSIRRLQELPGVSSLQMTAKYPIATTEYEIKNCDIDVSMEASSPLVPNDVKNSSLPLSVFSFTLKNTSSSKQTVRIFQSQQNIVGWKGHADCSSGTCENWGGNVNTPVVSTKNKGFGGIKFENSLLASSDEFFGNLTLSSIPTSSNSKTSVIVSATDENDLWKQFVDASDVDIANAKSPSKASASKTSWSGAVVQTVDIPANSTATVTFALSWYFPNRMRETSVGANYDTILPSRLGNSYNNYFSNSTDVITYLESNVNLIDLTRTYVNAAFSSTIPPEILQSAFGRVAVLRSPTMWINQDDTVLGCEGNACCPLNCTHVYGYTTLIERMYPQMAKSMRESDFIRNFNLKIGGCTMRFGTGGWAIDGALANVIKTYLLVRQTGDVTWLSTVWNNVLAQMRYIIDTFDVDGDDVIRSAQQNTYDTAMYGVNTFIGSYYVVALRAAAKLAILMKDSSTQTEFDTKASRAAAKYDEICYSGDFGYYIADVSIKDCQYSYGPGCFVDQLCAAGLSLACDLGYVFDECHEQSARQAIVKYNIVSAPPFHDLQKHFFPGDKGITVCSYPNGKLGNGMMYDTLVSSGFTSPVIAGLIFDDRLDLALDVVGNIRARQDGRNRSPWNEPECNVLYSRAMAHFNLYDQACGFAYDATVSYIRVNPPSSVLSWATTSSSSFKCALFLDQGWGTFEQTKTSVIVTSLHGTLNILTFELARKESLSVSSATLDGKSVNVKWDGNSLTFDSTISIAQGEQLVVTFKSSTFKIKIFRELGKKIALVSDDTTSEGDFACHSTMLTATLAFCVGFAMAQFCGM